MPKSECFSDFIAEIQALGFSIASTQNLSSPVYGVIQGRTNQRWWLIPLAPSKVSVAGIALFQPITRSARVLKKAASVAIIVGMPGLWARNKIRIEGGNAFEEIFQTNDLFYAFFTGTDSPHRKTAIQIIDQSGNIKGYAKVSRNPAIRPLLSDEAKTLGYLRSMNLRSAQYPEVKYSGDIGGATVLVTDTRRTLNSQTRTSLTKHHQKFLKELAEMTRSGESLTNSVFLQKLPQQIERLIGKIPTAWSTRLNAAYESISKHSDSITAEMVFCHGDFTPWNSFMESGNLYVFDWEYAKKGFPPGYDLIHFQFSLPELKRLPVTEITGKMRRLLREVNIAKDDMSADVLMLCYLCGTTIHYIGREAEVDGKVIEWDGEQEAAVLIDAISCGATS